MMPNWNLPWLQESGEIPPSVHFIDPSGEHSETSSPEWLMQLPPQPTIYLSLGTVFNQIYPEIFDHTISALREEPFNLIISLGDKQADSGRFGLLPKSIRVESFIPHSEVLGLLPQVDLFIGHGGANSTIEALSFGVPLILLPLSAEQPIIAEICIALGAAIPLPSSALQQGGMMTLVNPTHLNPSVIRDVVQQALGTPTYRNAAKKLKSDLHTLPQIEAAVKLLEQFANC